MLDQLTLLVDKSLVVAEDSAHGTRYRLLETVRQYAQEKLHESREGNEVRARHRDHYTAMAGLLERRPAADHERRIEQAETEIDNLRAAFAWSRENSDTALALTLASALLPLWLIDGPHAGRARTGSTPRLPMQARRHRAPAARVRAVGRQSAPASLSRGIDASISTRPSELWQRRANSATRRSWRGR